MQASASSAVRNYCRFEIEKNDSFLNIVLILAIVIYHALSANTQGLGLNDSPKVSNKPETLQKDGQIRHRSNQKAKKTNSLHWRQLNGN